MQRTITAAHPAYQVYNLVLMAGMVGKAELYSYLYDRKWEADDWGDDDPYAAPMDDKIGLPNVAVDEGMMHALDRLMGEHQDKMPARSKWELAIYPTIRVMAGKDAWGGIRWHQLHLACWDGNGSPSGRHFEAIMDECSQMFPGKTVYIYYSGHSYHAYINTLIDSHGNDIWTFRDMLNQHTGDGGADGKWIERGGGLRWSEGGGNRPAPYLKKWYTL